jgi:hypothetical protein
MISIRWYASLYAECSKLHDVSLVTLETASREDVCVLAYVVQT